MEIWSRIKSDTDYKIEYMFYEVFMSNDILRKIYSELLQEKTELELEQSSIVIKLKENEKYIQRLKTEEEDNFDLFSPRSQNQDFRKSMDSFEQENQSLSQRNREIEIAQEKLNEKIQGLKQIFQDENNLSEKRVKQKKKFRKIKEAHAEDLSFIISKLEFCFKIVDVDPVRCKSELSLLIRSLNEKTNRDHIQKTFEVSEEVKDWNRFD